MNLANLWCWTILSELTRPDPYLTCEWLNEGSENGARTQKRLNPNQDVPTESKAQCHMWTPFLILQENVTRPGARPTLTL